MQLILVILDWRFKSEHQLCSKEYSTRHFGQKEVGAQLSAVSAVPSTPTMETTSTRMTMISSSGNRSVKSTANGNKRSDGTNGSTKDDFKGPENVGLQASSRNAPKPTGQVGVRKP